MHLPDSILPILKKITEGKESDIEFWRSLDGDDLIEAFFELSGELMMADLEEDSLPEGYVLLAYIFYWETNCQFSGWYAIENKRHEMDKIKSCYRKVGLPSEATALEKAVEVWFSSNQDHDAVGRAYRSITNEYSDEQVRFEYLAKYFAANANRLLYLDS